MLRKITTEVLIKTLNSLTSFSLSLFHANLEKHVIETKEKRNNNTAELK